MTPRAGVGGRSSRLRTRGRLAASGGSPRWPDRAHSEVRQGRFPAQATSRPIVRRGRSAQLSRGRRVGDREAHRRGRLNAVQNWGTRSDHDERQQPRHPPPPPASERRVTAHSGRVGLTVGAHEPLGASTTNVMRARKPKAGPPGMTGPGPDRTHPTSPAAHLMTAGIPQPVAGADGMTAPAARSFHQPEHPPGVLWRAPPARRLARRPADSTTRTSPPTSPSAGSA